MLDVCVYQGQKIHKSEGGLISTESHVCVEV